MTTLERISQRNHLKTAPNVNGIAGFSLIEVMISITILLLGVISTGGVMVLSQQNSVRSEQRYQNYADFRNRVEAFKSQVSSTFPTGYTATASTSTGLILGITNIVSGVDSDTSGCSKPLTVTGDTCSLQVSTAPAGLTNLTRMEMNVPAGSGSKPVQVIHYVRVGESRNVAGH
jgi:prepilin-type N-terminal cleavage/methylation domain-containing protein